MSLVHIGVYVKSTSSLHGIFLAQNDWSLQWLDDRNNYIYMKWPILWSFDILIAEPWLHMVKYISANRSQYTPRSSHLCQFVIFEYCWSLLLFHLGVWEYIIELIRKSWSLEFNSSPLRNDGWNTGFLLGWPILMRKLLVSGGGICSVPQNTQLTPTIQWCVRASPRHGMSTVQTNNLGLSRRIVRQTAQTLGSHGTMASPHGLTIMAGDGC